MTSRQKTKTIILRDVQKSCNSKDKKFKQYFRLTLVLCEYALNNIIRDDASPKTIQKTQKVHTLFPEEKLCKFLIHVKIKKNFSHVGFDF